MKHQGSGGLFIVFEGGEGSGKTTQVRMLSEWLTAQGHDLLVTKQPGGDESICKGIRSLILDPQYFGQVSPRAEFLLFMADKAQHVDFVIKPALEQGKIVISDRYMASTYAYQVAARRSCTQDEFDYVGKYATRGFKPDLTIWLDVDPSIGMTRNSSVPSQQLRFEKEDLAFHVAVRKGYEDFFTTYADSSTVLRVDANNSIKQNHGAIIERMQTVFTL